MSVTVVELSRKPLKCVYRFICKTARCTKERKFFVGTWLETWGKSKAL